MEFDGIKTHDTHPTLFGINIILLNIPRHPKICHLTLLSFTNKNIPRRQVTMNYLKENDNISNCLASLFSSFVTTR